MAMTPAPPPTPAQTPASVDVHVDRLDSTYYEFDIHVTCGARGPGDTGSSMTPRGVHPKPFEQGARHNAGTLR
eukprot:1450945-Pyramimonas_sp.AAC.1